MLEYSTAAGRLDKRKSLSDPSGYL